MMAGQNAGSVITAKRIKPGTVGVEIGVWRGDTSALFLRQASHLHLVDPWSVAPYEQGGEFPDYAAYLSRYEKEVGSKRPSDFEGHYENVYRHVKRRFAGSPVTIHRMQSAQFFKALAEQVDWVYIDGLHSYKACMADLVGAHRIVKPGGFIYGDDYGMHNHHRLGGVSRAVDDFSKSEGLNVTKLGGLQFEIAL